MATSLTNTDQIRSLLKGIEHVPGGEIVTRAYESLSEDIWETESVLLIALYTNRLSSLGFEIPNLSLSPLAIKLKLYHMLSLDHLDPHAVFKAREQRLLKLMGFLEREALISTLSPPTY